jgi:hypothetical protein
MAIAIAVLSAFGFVFAIVAFACHVARRPGAGGTSCLEGFFWVLTILFVLITVILEGVGLDLTKFGDTPVASVNNYYEQDNTFRTYYNTHANRINESISEPVPQWVNEYRRNHSQELEHESLDLSDSVVPFYRQDGEVWTLLSVKSVILNWEKLVNEGKLLGADPCDYGIDSDAEVGSIGNWDAGSFKDLWCSKYTEWARDQEWERDEQPSDSEKKRRYASRLRSKNAIDNLSGFYGHNTYFIGINTAALVFLFFAVVLDFCTRGAEPGARDGIAAGAGSGSSK